MKTVEKIAIGFLQFMFELRYNFFDIIVLGFSFGLIFGKSIFTGLVFMMIATFIRIVFTMFYYKVKKV